MVGRTLRDCELVCYLLVIYVLTNFGSETYWQLVGSALVDKFQVPVVCGQTGLTGLYNPFVETGVILAWEDAIQCLGAEH